MDLTDLVPLIANGGVAAVVLVVFVYLVVGGHLVSGKIYESKVAECEKLKEAVAAERGRGDTAVAAAAAVRELLLAVRGGAASVAEQEKG